MKTAHFLWVFMLFLNCVTGKAQSCDTVACCGCVGDDLSPSGSIVSHEHPKGTWKVAYRYMNMLMKTKLYKDKKVEDDFVFKTYFMSPQSMKMEMHMAMLMYGFTDRFSTMLMLNYYSLSMDMNMSTTYHHGPTLNNSQNDSLHEMHSSTSGLGDSKIYLIYSLWKTPKNHFIFSGGVSIPTGNYKIEGNRDDLMYPSQRFPYMFQLGSGTLDFMPGLTYLALLDKVALSLQIKAVIRPNINSIQYRLGDELMVNAWGAYQWLPWLSTSVRIAASSVKPIVGMDPSLLSSLEPAARTLNYGGKVLKSFFGLNVYFNKAFLANSKLTMEYGIPLYEKYNGIQLSQNSTWNLGWVYSF